jgi:hypothetical protein
MARKLTLSSRPSHTLSHQPGQPTMKFVNAALILATLVATDAAVVKNWNRNTPDKAHYDMYDHFDMADEDYNHVPRLLQTKAPKSTNSPMPSSSPSQEPSRSPSASPSRSPSASPSQSPSASPSRSPSVLVTCNDWQYFEGGICKNCPNGQVSLDDSPPCDPCPAGQVCGNAAGTTQSGCVPANGICGDWQFAESGICKNCNNGQVSLDNTAPCETCPDGQVRGNAVGTGQSGCVPANGICIEGAYFHFKMTSYQIRNDPNQRDIIWFFCER